MFQNPRLLICLIQLQVNQITMHIQNPSRIIKQNYHFMKLYFDLIYKMHAVVFGGDLNRMMEMKAF